MQMSQSVPLKRITCHFDELICSYDGVVAVVFTHSDVLSCHFKTKMPDFALFSKRQYWLISIFSQLVEHNQRRA